MSKIMNINLSLPEEVANSFTVLRSTPPKDGTNWHLFADLCIPVLVKGATIVISLINKNGKEVQVASVDNMLQINEFVNKKVKLFKEGCNFIIKFRGQAYVITQVK